MSDYINDLWHRLSLFKIYPHILDEKERSNMIFNEFINNKNNDKDTNNISNKLYSDSTNKIKNLQLHKLRIDIIKNQLELHRKSKENFTNMRKLINDCKIRMLKNRI